MIQVVSAFVFALAVVPFSNGCKNLLGEDKNENKKKTVEMLRELADMLEEQEDRLGKPSKKIKTKKLKIFNFRGGG